MNSSNPPFTITFCCLLSTQFNNKQMDKHEDVMWPSSCRIIFRNLHEKIKSVLVKHCFLFEVCLYYCCCCPLVYGEVCSISQSCTLYGHYICTKILLPKATEPHLSLHSMSLNHMQRTCVFVCLGWLVVWNIGKTNGPKEVGGEQRGCGAVGSSKQIADSLFLQAKWEYISSDAAQ